MSVVGGDEVTTYSDVEFIDDRENVQYQDPSLLSNEPYQRFTGCSGRPFNGWGTLFSLF